MKKSLLALAIIGLFAVSSFAAEAYTLKARVPFDFTVGMAQVPAGVYSIERTSTLGVMLLRDAAGHAKAIFPVNSIQSPHRYPEAMLVFNKYGDQYFLHRVWTPTTISGAELKMTKIERELVASVPATETLVAATYR